MLKSYQKNTNCQDALLYEPFTGSPVPVSDLTRDMIVLINRASTEAQTTAHDAKFAYMEATIGNVGKKVIKKAFNGSGRLKPIYEFNESHGLSDGYKATWFGALEKIINAVLDQSFPGQRASFVLFSPDRLARSQYFHPHVPQTWGLTDTDYEQFDEWKQARFGRRCQYIRFLTCFTGTPEQCRGLQSKIGMRYCGNLGGRPKGSRNKKPRITLTPKQKTALRNTLHDEIPYLVKELKLNGAECYRYLKGHYPVVPVIKRTVQRWAVEERGTPGKSGKPKTKPTLPEPKNKCVILFRCYKRPSGTHPAFIRTKRIRSIDRPLPPKGYNFHSSFFPYFQIRIREVHDPP